MERSAIRDLAREDAAPDFASLHPGYLLRLSYANSTENILKALDRMGEFLSSRKAA
jgi:hypothetical protein